MTIQDIGSVGELVGAIATVATLLYLAVQIRQSARLVESSIAGSARDAENEVGRLLHQEPPAAQQAVEPD